MFLAVMDGEGEADELRQDRRAPAPGLDGLVAARLARGFGDLRFKGLIEKEFRESFIEQNLVRGRVTGILALGMILALTVTDYLFGATPGTELLNVLRLYVLCPLVSLIVVATFHPGGASSTAASATGAGSSSASTTGDSSTVSSGGDSSAGSPATTSSEVTSTTGSSATSSSATTSSTRAVASGAGLCAWIVTSGRGSGSTSTLLSV